MERRVTHDALFSQHDRAAYRDERQPEPDLDSLYSAQTASQQRPASPHRSAVVALSAVDRIFDDLQPSGARYRVEATRGLSLQYLPNGEELDRARRPRPLDARPGASRRR